jgi:carbamoyltransferase
MTNNRNIIIGINWEQNSTAAIMINNKLVGCVSEERFSNVKNDERYPKKAIDWLIKTFKVKKYEIKSINFISNFWSPTYSLIRHYSKFNTEDYIKEQKEVWYPRIYGGKKISQIKVFQKKIDIHQYPGKHYWKKYIDYLKKNNDHGSEIKILDLGKKIRSEIVCNHLKISKKIVKFIDHSTGHAAYAYFSKKNKSRKTLVLTLDAFGDHVNYSARTIKINSDNTLTSKKIVEGNDFIIGRLYRYVTLILGLKPNEHEYKVMGLAPYCKPSYSKKIVNIFEKFQKVKNIKFSYINKPKDFYFEIKKCLDGQRFDTIASGLQTYTENLIIQWIKNLIKKTKISNICLAGGVSMNVKSNMLISKISSKINLFVPACPDDASQAMGACYAHFLDKDEKTFKESFIESSYLGPQSTELSKAMKSKLKKKGYKIVEKNYIKKAAKLLQSNMILGRFCGNAEFGARALGNRSILANPNNLEIKNKINDKIKSRDFWMPFAASVPQKYAKKYFYLDSDLESYKYMTNCANTTNAGKTELAAAIHPYDKTCRPHIIQKGDNENYEKLILEFGKITNTYALLNTSFNQHGYPIINSLNQALNILQKSNLDGLILSNCLIFKNKFTKINKKN